MGEPRPGDFCDPINVKSQRVKLEANQVGKAGDFVKHATSGFWTVINLNNLADRSVATVGTIAQLQHDVISGPIAGVVSASVFGIGSWFYALSSGSATQTNDYVFLTRFANTIGMSAITGSVPISAITFANDHVTITVPDASYVKKGDDIDLSGQDNSSLVGRFRVMDTTATTITLFNAEATGTVTIFGTFVLIANADGAHAQFVKKSGGTFQTDAGGLNDIGIYSMLSGGRRVTREF